MSDYGEFGIVDILLFTILGLIVVIIFPIIFICGFIGIVIGRKEDEFERNADDDCV